MSDGRPVDVRGRPLESERWKGLSNKVSIDVGVQENYRQSDATWPLKMPILTANDSWRIIFTETAYISDVIEMH